MDSKLVESEAARDGDRILEEDPQIIKRECLPYSEESSLQVAVLADKVAIAKDNNSKTTSDLQAAKKQYQVIRDMGKEKENDEIEEEETGITRKDKEDGPDAPENKEKDRSGESAQAETKKDEKNKLKNAILVVAALITTLTYQALLNPPSTLFKQGTEIDWGCLGKHLGRGLIKGMKECPAGLTFAFLFVNTTIFLNSILMLVWTLPIDDAPPEIIYLIGLTIYLTVSYSILLMAFSYYTAYIVIAFWCVVFIFFAIRHCSFCMDLMHMTDGPFDREAYQHQNETGDTEDDNAEAPKNEEKEEGVKLAPKDLTEDLVNAILVVATLIITLTYQALLNPPSTLFKQGSQIDWGCIGKYHRHGLINHMKECPAELAFAFLFVNTYIFFYSIYILYRTLLGYQSSLVGVLILTLVGSYCILLMASSYYAAYVAIPLCFVTFVLSLNVLLDLDDAFF